MSSQQPAPLLFCNCPVIFLPPFSNERRACKLSCGALRNTYSKFLLAYEMQARALGMRKSPEEHTPILEEATVQPDSKHHQVESAGAPIAACTDVPGQGSISGGQAEDHTVESMAAMHDTPQQAADSGKADAPVILAQHTADVEMCDSMDVRKLEQAPVHAEHVLEAEVGGPSEEEHPAEKILEQGLTDAAGLEPLEGAPILKPASQTSNLQDVEMIS